MSQITLTRGKGDFVLRKTNNGIENVCLCIYNGDGTEGCISQVPSYLIEGVMKNKGKYAESTKIEWIKKHGKIPDFRCDYCYARRHNKANIEEKVVGEKTRESFEKYQPKFVRLSKNTEWGHSIFRKSLLNFIDLATEYNAQIIFPTKMLEFDEEVAKALIDNRGFLSFSIGRDASEPGCCGFGFNNKQRVKEAEKYYDFGVNTALTMVFDVTDSIENNEKRGFNLRDALDSYIDSKRKRIIPMRLTSAKVALLVTGIERQDLINPYGAVDHIKGWEKYSPEVQKRILSIPYSKRENNDLVANFIHSDFKEFEDNLRICGQIGEYEYCDKCNLLPYSEKLRFHISEIPGVDYAPNRNKLQNKRRKTIPSKRKGMVKQKVGKQKIEKNIKIDFNFKNELSLKNKSNAFKAKPSFILFFLIKSLVSLKE